VPAPHLGVGDEFAITTALTRPPARAVRGERAVVTAPCPYGRSLAVVSALAVGGGFAPRAREGAVNGAGFALEVEHLRAPALRADDSVFLAKVKCP
jgi:hypothetical protein